MNRYQVTLICTNGKYKPVSTIVNVSEEFSLTKQEITHKGIENICFKKMWSSADLKRYGYTKVKCRVYDPEKIAAENKAKYEALKEQKYASGEWKRPKKDEKNA